jgi:hypothetical protein
MDTETFSEGPMGVPHTLQNRESSLMTEEQPGHFMGLVPFSTAWFNINTEKEGNQTNLY